MSLRSSSGSEHTRLMGVGAFRPERVVTNEEVCRHIDSSDEWIRQRTGIESRRWADAATSVVDMSLGASIEAVAAAGLAPADIDTVIVATVTHDYQTPSAAAMLTDRLGATPAAAWDVSAGCAGFCHALAQAADAVRAGTSRHVLVVGADKITDYTDLTDRATAFLFADGAGAVVVGPSDTPGIGPTVWGSDGGQWQAIRNKASWPSVREAMLAAAGDPEHEPLEWPALTQEGQQVFRWAVWQMAPVAQKAIDAAGVTADDLAAFVPHQANARIIDAMVKQLKLPEHVHVAKDIRTAGNTSAASVPLAMHRVLADGEARSGDLALLIGYGAGLAYAAQVVVLP
ncbi:MAG: 3-oxoacyl-[acyl-carrier-protein] synthase, KASIII [uncultured Quadrisphaera sp.]|uniref:Beta-ketoacyl-[acyl-carrier-protein] synthase III n=1 Tax=uncultured Quadrisphaera sp. TaxID=904978 RepID=A0A6J4NFY7_9ACTN|nr:MAG: 3-oxoacyl-[acyl-carrier-protein] synthase, KASIII [uncultured Quadrisphaera sp.]